MSDHPGKRESFEKRANLSSKSGVSSPQRDEKSLDHIKDESNRYSLLEKTSTSTGIHRDRDHSEYPKVSHRPYNNNGEPYRSFHKINSGYDHNSTPHSSRHNSEDSIYSNGVSSFNHNSSYHRDEHFHRKFSSRQYPSSMHSSYRHHNETNYSNTSSHHNRHADSDQRHHVNNNSNLEISKHNENLSSHENHNYGKNSSNNNRNYSDSSKGIENDSGYYSEKINSYPERSSSFSGRSGSNHNKSNSNYNERSGYNQYDRSGSYHVSHNYHSNSNIDSINETSNSHNNPSHNYSKINNGEKFQESNAQIKPNDSIYKIKNDSDNSKKKNPLLEYYLDLKKVYHLFSSSDRHKLEESSNNIIKLLENSLEVTSLNTPIDTEAIKKRNTAFSNAYSSLSLSDYNLRIIETDNDMILRSIESLESIKGGTWPDYEWRMPLSTINKETLLDEVETEII